MNTIICRVEIKIAYVHSLKEKRSVIKKVIMGTRNIFNISIAEVGHQDLWQTTVLGFAIVGSKGANLESLRDNIINYIEENFETEITKIENELIAF